MYAPIEQPTIVPSSKIPLVRSTVLLNRLSLGRIASKRTDELHPRGDAAVSPAARVWSDAVQNGDSMERLGEDVGCLGAQDVLGR